LISLFELKNNNWETFFALNLKMNEVNEFELNHLNKNNDKEVFEEEVEELGFENEDVKDNLITKNDEENIKKNKEEKEDPNHIFLIKRFYLLF
jgi:hypothetical protein